MKPTSPFIYAISILLISSSIIAAPANSFSGSSPKDLPGALTGQARVGVLVAEPGLLRLRRIQGLNPKSNLAQQLELQAQELDLERQSLLIKQNLIDLQYANALKEQTSTLIPNVHWVDTTPGKVPPKAINASPTPDAPLYICHARYINGVHPGQWVNNGCLISYAGKTQVQTYFEVLTNDSDKSTATWKEAKALQSYLRMENDSWVRYQESTVGNPVPGGYEHTTPLYICRTVYNNVTHLGKILDNGRSCNISIEDKEVSTTTFEVLFN